MRLPIGEDYQRAEDENFDAVFTNGSYVVAISRITFSAGFLQGVPDTMSAREFAYFFMNKTDRNCELHTDSLTPYYIYFEDGYFYLNAFYRSPHAYFTVLLSASEGLYPDCLDPFVEIINGAKFVY